MMNRRALLTSLGSAAAWPLAARTQQAAVPVIGFLRSTSPDSIAENVAAFRRGLAETGFVEGRSVAIDFRWPQDQNDRLSALAADLVRRQVAMIFASGGTAVAVAAKSATSTIPIVFVNGGDAVKSSLVASLGRPGGNVTGVSLFAAALGTKKLGLLRELVGNANTIGMLANPNNLDAKAELNEVQEAARSIGQQLNIFLASTERDIEAAFATVAEQRVGALIVSTDPYFYTRRAQIITLAARQVLPTIYDRREFAAGGGLISYGTRFADVFREAGIYAGRILNGAKPADLPVLQPTKFELVVNLKTAKALGLMISEAFLLLADEVIE